ncbi:hypothetical protein GQ600_26458 [Phytophthora cactorum]|nr:hypothetical protein GQ600_26458 [Phytophthora cactorum]
MSESAKKKKAPRTSTTTSSRAVASAAASRTSPVCSHPLRSATISARDSTQRLHGRTQRASTWDALTLAPRTCLPGT